jgi:hypothetical protein
LAGVARLDVGDCGDVTGDAADDVIGPDFACFVGFRRSAADFMKQFRPEFTDNMHVLKIDKGKFVITMTFSGFEITWYIEYKIIVPCSPTT